jgi:putative FmdB family regulatory protein
MPFYEYGCNECSHEFEEFKTMAEYNAPLSEPCPSCYKVGYIDRLISGAEICDPVSLGVRKVPKGYNEVIKNMKKSYPGNTLEVRE